MAFISHQQTWNHASGTTATTIHVMESNGHAFVEAYVDDVQVEIGNLSVDDQYRGIGIGEKILFHIENLIPHFQSYLDNNSVIVEIEPNSPLWLHQWYSKRGYQVRVRDYEDEQEDYEEEEDEEEYPTPTLIG